MTIPNSVRSTDECEIHSMKQELLGVKYNTGVRKNVLKLGSISGLRQFSLYSHRIARERSLR